MSQIPNQISILAAGFSIIGLLLLFFQHRTESKSAKILSKSLLISLLVVQLIQYFFITNVVSFDGILALVYLLSLGLVAPAFYLYSQHIIKAERILSIRDGLHFIPSLLITLVGAIEADYFSFAYAAAFLIGGVYMMMLVTSLYQRRERRTLFKMEFSLTACFLAWALMVVLVGLFNEQAMNIMVPVQMLMLSIAIAAAIHIQLNFPHLLSSIEEIASRQYQTSTLTNVDCEDLQKRLETLMSDQEVYQDSELSLSSLAPLLQVKPHQLSEFLNTHLDIGFSSYLRNVRVDVASDMLKSEPNASVLSIGLSVGFSSQSAFYSAFKLIHSMAPGQYRKQHLTD